MKNSHKRIFQDSVFISKYTDKEDLAHESPYLNKGNTETLLKTGMTFTSEPGIYLVDQFGVRHEDILLVNGDNEPYLLTGRRAQGPWDP